MTKSTPAGGYNVTVHPLVLLSVVDHFTRVIGLPTTFSDTNKDRQKRVVGVLLGQMNHTTGQVNVSNSYAIPFEEDEKNDHVWYLDQGYLEDMFELFKKVSARERIIGWYHTGPKLRANDLHIHQLFKRYATTPVLVVIDVEPKVHGIPTDAYVAVEELQTGKESSWTFSHLSSQIEAEEAEEIGVEHLLRDILEHSLVSLCASQGTRRPGQARMAIEAAPAFTSGLPLSQRLVNYSNSLTSFSLQLANIAAYLGRVQTDVLPLNQPILAMLQNIIHMLPDLEHDPEWQDASIVKSNDKAAIVYLSAMIRSCLALHSLVDNKLHNVQKEKDLLL